MIFLTNHELKRLLQLTNRTVKNTLLKGRAITPTTKNVHMKLLKEHSTRNFKIPNLIKL